MRRQRPGDRDPLPLTAREFVRELVAVGQAQYLVRDSLTVECRRVASFLASNRAGDPEADASLPGREAWGIAVAVGRTADRRVVRPRAAAQYPWAVR